MTELIRVLAIGTALAVAGLAWQHARAGKFYQETPWGWFLGIFVWGDALVLGFWWAGVAVASWWLSDLWIWRIFLVFWVVRAFFEVIYWLNQQAVKSKEIPPLLRSVKWIGPNEAAILYQVGQMCVGITALIALALTTKL